VADKKKMTKLTDMVVTFQEKGTGLQTLIDTIALLVYAYPRKRFQWSEDDSSEFFCYLYPKLKEMIKKYRYSGKPFEAYLFTTIHWQLKTFASKLKKNKMKQELLSSHRLWDVCNNEEVYICEPEFTFSPKVRTLLKINDDNVVENPAMKKRIMYLMLKGADFINQHIITHVSIITGYDPDWLFCCAESLKERMRDRIKRLNLLKNRRNQLVLKIYTLHSEINGETDKIKKQHLMKELKKIRSRMERIIGLIRRVPRTPTHKDIAEVAGVPKGSVDSGLYYIKNVFLNDSDYSNQDIFTEAL